MEAYPLVDLALAGSFPSTLAYKLHDPHEQVERQAEAGNLKTL